MTIGASVGPYRMLRHLGSGGMGEVWLAEDTRLHRQVALKMVRADGDVSLRARLLKEAQAAAALNHQHIATVHDVLEQDGEIVVVFEYVEGETLANRIARGAMPPRDAVDIASQIAKGLAHAHAQGIVHRDLKPANVIVGVDSHVKILDFGIARMLAVGTTLTNPGAQPVSASALGFVGTASYAAPEQMVSAAVDERADLYALGVVLFEMISGERPFPGSDPVRLASSKLGTDAPPLSSTGHLVPPQLEQLVASLLSRERDLRPARASDALQQLRAIYGTSSTDSLIPTPTRRSSLAWVAAVVTVALVGTAVWGLRGRTEEKPSAPVIAVLPLANMSGDVSRDFVAAGVAENLIASLATLPTVTVLSRASVAEARGRFKEQDALIKDLGATYLVEGSVQEAGGRMKISLNLVRPDRSVAWGDSVDGTFDRFFEMQSRLASALTSALVVRVSASERERMNEQPTTNPLAMEAYWQGKALLERGDLKGNVDAAIAEFQRAAHIDERCALARVGLSQAYRRKYVETKEPSWATQAIDEATNALRLAPDSAEARYVLAVTLNGAGRTKDAIDELNRALAIRPNYEDARRQLGLVLADTGQIDAAIIEFKKAIALRPTSPSGYATMGYALLQASRYKESAEAFEEAVRIAPDIFTGYQQLGTAYQYLGDNDRALENYRKAIAIRESAPAYSNIGALLHQRGDFQGAADAYRHAIAIRPNAATTHGNLGDALSRLGQTAEARAEYLEAIRLFETDLRVNPNDARSMIFLAVASQKAGRPDSAKKYVSSALKLLPDNPDVLYRAATVSVLEGDSPAALTHLEHAIKNGFSKTYAAADDDLGPLRSSERFKALIKEGQ